MRETNLDFLYLVTAPVMLLLCLAVSFRRKNRNREAGVYLVGYYWSYFLAITVTFIVLSPLIHQVPHIFRTGQAFFLLLIPSSYLYFRETLFPGRRSFRDLLLLLPLGIYLLDYMPFFLLSGEGKMSVLKGLDAQGMKVSFAEGWFMPAGAHNLVKYLFAMVLWVAQGRILWKARRIASLETGQDFIKHRQWLGWLHWSQLLIFLPSMLVMALGRMDILTLIANASGMMAGIVQGFYLILHPEVLYGLPTDAPETAKAFQHPPANNEPVSFPEERDALKASELPAYAEQLDEATLDEIEKALIRVLEEKKPHLDPGLKIADLAMATGFLSYKLSAYFRKRGNGNFYDFINEKRVGDCIRKLESGDYQAKTLEALSQESGFQSRSTFIRAFKKVKGVTPREFLQEIKT